MALSALPTEILSRICRFIILRYGIDDCSYALPQDLQSLRLSCRAIYQKTLFDAGIVYGGMLDPLVVKLTYKSLGVLLSISSTPYFRDRVRILYFDWSQGGYDGWDDEADYFCSLERDERDTFTFGPDAIYILTESFRNLAKSTSLSKVYLCEERTYPAVFAALDLASFPRQIVYVEAEPRKFSQPSHDRFLNPLFESPHLISEIQFQAPPHPDLNESRPYDRKHDVAHNEHGHHYSGYKSITPPLSDLATKLCRVEKISFFGCDNIPRLRLCHGCEDMWVSLFANNIYPHLTHFALGRVYVSGSRLRGFIKRHATTLQTVEFGDVTLTDGSWRSVAQGLRKCRSLDYLNMGLSTPYTGGYRTCPGLLQKRATSSPAARLPEEFVKSGIEHMKRDTNSYPSAHIRLHNKTDVTRWLDVFIRYFATIERDARMDWADAGHEPPVYHEACTFFLPNWNENVPDVLDRAYTAMCKYLEAAEEA